MLFDFHRSLSVSPMLLTCCLSGLSGLASHSGSVCPLVLFFGILFNGSCNDRENNQSEYLFKSVSTKQNYVKSFSHSPLYIPVPHCSTPAVKWVVVLRGWWSHHEQLLCCWWATCGRFPILTYLHFCWKKNLSSLLEWGEEAITLLILGFISVT